MWYVVHVLDGKEYRVLHLVERLVDTNTIQECFVPQYEMMRKNAGTWKRFTEILFPGYLFVITDQVDRAAEAFAELPAYTRLLGNDKGFTPLSADEIQFNDSFTKRYKRIIELSEGVIEGEEIRITKGPLMHKVGLVKKIDRHKRLAYLETTMFGRTMNIKVGLEIVGKYTGNPI